jgi:hypothetical protein
MSWNDDSWRDSYDSWKLASPDDDYPDCDHDRADLDILDGRWRCTCGEAWNATEEEIRAEIDREIEYAVYEARENRRQWRRDFFAQITLPIRWPIFRLLEKIWPRKSVSVLLDDEIPF